MWQILLYLNYATFSLALLAFLPISFFAALAKHKKRKSFAASKAIAPLIFLVYFYILVRPVGGWSETGQSDPSITLNPVDAFRYADAGLTWQMAGLNMLLFVPLGIIVFLAANTSIVMWLAGPLFSFAIEASQSALGTGRQSDTVDLVANSAGYITGVAFSLAALFAVRYLTRSSVHTGSEANAARG
ncbi:VanZ like protein [Haloactinospora alba]|uniref:VanZ like protein n=1 Tax=Haloactinospora alba TaxID=405555 RepID=A0A543NEH0_9ACTN|nr:VanZ family protein [Haloactinospora alba]TQN30215.1 VanZ like protein [Haloactinospora alba]